LNGTSVYLQLFADSGRLWRNQRGFSTNLRKKRRFRKVFVLEQLLRLPAQEEAGKARNGLESRTNCTIDYHDTNYIGKVSANASILR
jgi:hypothetical protein